MVDKKDKVGLYNQCVTVKLVEGGDIIEQNIYPWETHCQPIFLQAWQSLLKFQLGQVRNKACKCHGRMEDSVLVLHVFQDVAVECCQTDLCNGPARTLRSEAKQVHTTVGTLSSSSDSWSFSWLVLTFLIIWHCYSESLT